ncbi:TPA: hypothetical protein PXJ64_000493 [Yersinia enterocolitica]|nr:hypothetical protein [Yersinia enterocolitica]
MNNIEELKKAALAATPGPWEKCDSYGPNENGTCVSAVERPDLMIASTTGYYGRDGEIANAHFISLANPAAILDMIAQLEAKNIRADACVNAFEGIETERFAGKSIGEFLTGEVRLNKAEPKPDGSFGFTFSGLAIQIMAESFADQFKSSGAVNYLELLFDHSEVGPLTVTMQRVERLTPAQKLAAVEAQLEAAQKSNSFLKEQMTQLANFNPDWDKLEACQDSWRELSALQKETLHRAELAEAALSAANEIISSLRSGRNER